MSISFQRARKIVAHKKGAATMLRRQEALNTQKRKRENDSIDTDTRKKIMGTAIEDDSDSEDGDLDQLSNLIKNPQKNKSNKKTENKSSASSWFDDMAKKIGGDSTGDKKKKRKKNVETFSFENVDEIAEDVEVLDADAIAQKFINNTVLLSERTDLWNAKEDRKVMKLEASKKKKLTAQEKLQRKLAEMDVEKKCNAGTDFLSNLMKKGNAGNYESDDEGDDVRVLTEEERYTPDTSIIGTEDFLDDYMSIEIGNEMEDENDMSAKKAKITHKFLVCAHQDEKIRAVREILEEIEENEKHSRVKTCTLVFVNEAKTATLLYSQIGRQYTKHKRNKRGYSGAGKELRTKNVEILHDQLKNWEMETTFVRFRSGRATTIVLTEGQMSKIWPLRGKVGQVIHFDIPEDHFEHTYNSRNNAIGRRCNNFPSNETHDENGDEIRPENLRNSSLFLMNKSKQSVKFVNSILPMIENNGQPKVSQALKDFVADITAKKYKFM